MWDSTGLPHLSCLGEYYSQVIRGIRMAVLDIPLVEEREEEEEEEKATIWLLYVWQTVFTYNRFT